jgi:transposase InsO family protein
MQERRIEVPNVYHPVIGGIKQFKQSPIVLQDKPTRWRGIAAKIELSDKGRLRLEWMIFYETMGKDAYATAKYFGIAPKTFYKWFNRFDNGKVHLLEDEKKTPKTKRKKEITFSEECRIKKLRGEHMKYGKRKLAKLYLDEYGEKISSWKIQYTINKYDLYPSKLKHDKFKAKIKAKTKKNRIQDLDIKEEIFFLFHLDTIVIYWEGFKRYILTACDHHGKIAYARMYSSKSSKAAKDFLYRLHYVVDAKIANVQTDNGSEFFDQFEEALKSLEIKHWFSRPRTPKDNSIVERFNQTLQYEWLEDGQMTVNLDRFNRALTEWLIEYNFRRPHETLNYKTPFEYYLEILSQDEKFDKHLLPMYSARTSG